MEPTTWMTVASVACASIAIGISLCMIIQQLTKKSPKPQSLTAEQIEKRNIMYEVTCRIYPDLKCKIEDFDPYDKTTMFTMECMERYSQNKGGNP